MTLTSEVELGAAKNTHGKMEAAFLNEIVEKVGFTLCWPVIPKSCDSQWPKSHTKIIFAKSVNFSGPQLNIEGTV